MNRKLLGLAAGLAVGVLALTGCGSDDGETPPSETPASQTDAVESCLNDGSVWLVVTDDTGTNIASQCVGNPESGTAALEAANVAITRDDGDFICALGNYPDPCPTSFTGEYWQYYTGVPGSDWTYQQAGSDDTKPTGGTIEGWCYGSECTPPALGGVTAPTPQPSDTTPTAAES